MALLQLTLETTQQWPGNQKSNISIVTESFVLTSLSLRKIVCNYTHILLIHLSLPYGFVQFPSKDSVMPSVTLDQNSLSLSVPSLFSLVRSFSIFIGLLVGVLEALPLLYFPVCGGSETEMRKRQREGAKKRELRKIEMIMMTISKEDRSAGNVVLMDSWMSVSTPRA